MREIRVYVVDLHYVHGKSHVDLTDEEFKTLSEKLKTVHTLGSFQEAFNLGMYDIHYVARFIEIGEDEILKELKEINQLITDNTTHGWVDSISETFSCVALEDVYSSAQDESDQDHFVNYNSWSEKLTKLISKLEK